MQVSAHATLCKDSMRGSGVTDLPPGPPQELVDGELHRGTVHRQHQQNRHRQNGVRMVVDPPGSDAAAVDLTPAVSCPVTRLMW